MRGSVYHLVDSLARGVAAFVLAAALLGFLWSGLVELRLLVVAAALLLVVLTSADILRERLFRVLATGIALLGILASIYGIYDEAILEMGSALFPWMILSSPNLIATLVLVLYLWRLFRRQADGSMHDQRT